MLLFGHTGITLGVAAVITALPPCRRWVSTHFPARLPPRAPASASPDPPPARFPLSVFRPLSDYADIRILMIGALLPDIIDKPLGHLIFREALSNGRTYAHTLLFLIVVFVLGTWLYHRAGRVWLLTLAFGSALHLILDQAWLTPRTLFWPLYSFAFTKSDLTGWLPRMVRSMYTDPAVYIPEIIGFLVIAAFAWQLLRQRKVVSFLRRGRL